MPKTEVGNNYSNLKFEVRSYPLPAAQIESILPMVAAVIDAVGFGSVVATDKGIQVTAPVEMLTNLNATIEAYKASPPAVEAYAFFGLFSFPSVTANFAEAIQTLGLCPPDMRCTVVPMKSGWSALLVAGPASRKKFYDEKVKVAIAAALPTREGNSLYLPLFDIHDAKGDVQAMIAGLGVLPPDMQCFAFRDSDRAGLAVAGPAERESDYKAKVKPQIQALINLLTGHA
jgi:hypothetical protein